MGFCDMLPSPRGFAPARTPRPGTPPYGLDESEHLIGSEGRLRNRQGEKGRVMPPPDRPRQLEIEDAFWDALLQLPGWPVSKHAIDTLLQDLTHNPDLGDQVVGTFVFIAKTIAPLPDDSLVRLVIYYAKLENGNLWILFADDYDHPSDTPHWDRLPPHPRSH